jgi:phosphoenolpyruvate carboxylase
MAPATGSREIARITMPEALRRDVRLLGELLGTVLREYGGEELLADVEKLRRLTIASHTDRFAVMSAEDSSVDDSSLADRAAREAQDLVASWSRERAVEVARAFTVYFHLVNLAEQQHRIRSLRAKDTAETPLRDSIAEALTTLQQQEGPDAAFAALQRLELRPVLTAHPTEARRRAIVAALRLVSDLLAVRDAGNLGASELMENRRRLLEQVDVLWRTAPLREQRPGPLDEVRTAMAVFDDVLFRVVPQLYRSVDTALAGDEAGVRPGRVPAFLRLGTWIGGDRDGNPYVTSTTTHEAMGIQAEHALRGLENASARIGRGLTCDAESTPPSAALVKHLENAAIAYPELYERLFSRSRGEPHRIAVLLAAERLKDTRVRNADMAYENVDEFISELRLVQESLMAAGAVRLAYGELQHLIWQAQTFGFHLAEMEVRQHGKVHATALDELSRNKRSAQTEEVLATIRVMARLQQRFGPDAARRYVVSFTQGPEDVAAVYDLAGYALDGRNLELDVVPLFETGEDLEHCIDILDKVIQLPNVQARLAKTGRRYEVMLGYSDSAKDVGPVSATLALYEAQARLADWADRHDIQLTLFHGRGGALGRGGGPANKAVLAQPPGSVAGRFKVTEQGEVIFARYGDQHIAHRHLEQVAAAVILSSSPAVEERAAHAAREFTDVATTLDHAAREAYHALVRDPEFPTWFHTVTPLEELGSLAIGSRPARRGMSASSIEDLRAIPWVFAWAQARINAPGWYGLGSGLEAVGDLVRLRQAYAEWPLFSVILEIAEMSLAKTDRRIMSAYMAMANHDHLVNRVLDEHERTVNWVLDVTGHTRLLEDKSVLGRAVALRNPYVDALSYLQLRALRVLRSDTELPEEEAADLRRLLLISVNGVAAGLQNTG